MERPELQPHHERVRQLFDGYPLQFVEVYCPLEICRARNIARGDRGETQSEEQSRMMAPDIQYTYRVDTSLHTSEQCAALIIEALFQRQGAKL